MRAPATVAALVLVVHVAWIGLVLARGFEARDFIGLGSHWITMAPQGHGIAIDPGYHYVANGIGYDGQWSYFIAVDPGGAAAHIDGPTYRYGRILYPLLARAVALGRVEWVPAALIAVNLAAVAVGTLALAAWLRSQGVSPWAAAVFGLYPGIVIGLHRDLTEPVAYSLCAVAAWALAQKWRGAAVAAGALFGLAVLAREVAAVFPLVYGATALARATAARRPQPAYEGLALLLLGLLPFAAWELYLQHWLGPLNTGQAAQFARLPFGGFWGARPWHVTHLRDVATVIAPGVVAGAAAVVMLRRAASRPEPWLLLANVLLFVVFLPPQSYVDPVAAPRVAIGVVLAGVLCLPAARTVLRSQAWFAVAAVLWLSTLPLTLVLNLFDHPAGLVRV